MTTPAKNVYLSQTARVEGTMIYYGNQTRISREGTIMRLIDRRPKSSTNPILEDGSRRDSGWNHEVASIAMGSGQCVERSFRGGNLTYAVSGQVTRPGVPDPGGVDHSLALRLLNDARMKALSGISESKSQFNVAAYEAKGTIGTLKQFCEKAVRGVEDAKRALKRRDPRLALPPRAWKSWPGDYLGYLYGLKPLADDISNGLDQLSGLSRLGMAYGYKVRGHRKVTENFREEVQNTYQANFKYFAPNCVRNAFGRVGYRYVFPKWWLENTPIVTPFSDAWELTKLSFVVDWAIPFGPWIGAMEAAQFDPYFVGGYEVWGTEELVRGPFTGDGSAYGFDLAMSNPGYLNRRYAMRRLGLTRFDKPTGRLDFPSFREFLDLNKASQALSLLSQAFNSPARGSRS